MSTEGDAKNGHETRGQCGRSEEGRAVTGDVDRSLWCYLRELGFRIIKCIAAVAVAFIGCWIFRQTMLDIVTRPYELVTAAEGMESDLAFYSYVGPVKAQLKAVLFAAIVITAPWLVYQVWASIVFCLHPKKRRQIVRMVVPSVICLLAAVAFAYFFAIPATLRSLLRTAGPRLTMRAYLSLFFKLTLGLAAAFEAPVVVWYLVSEGATRTGTAQEKRTLDKHGQRLETEG